MEEKEVNHSLHRLPLLSKEGYSSNGIEHKSTNASSKSQLFEQSLKRFHVLSTGLHGEWI
jgi:hypothetical protein